MIIGGFEIILLAVAVVVAVVTWLATESNLHLEKMQMATVGFFVAFCVLSIIYGVAKFDSYHSSKKLVALKVNIVQESLTLRMYVVASDRPTGAKGNQAISDLTDKKYDGYQKYLSAKTTDLKDTVTEYNRLLMTKRAWKKDFMWRAFIVAPDESLQPVNLENIIPAEFLQL